MKLRWIVAAGFAAVATAAPAQFAIDLQGKFQDQLFGFGWTPTCNEPTMVFGDTGAFREEAAEYIDCVNRQAKNDAYFAIQKIKEGRDKAIREMSERLND